MGNTGNKNSHNPGKRRRQSEQDLEKKARIKREFLKKKKKQEAKKKKAKQKFQKKAREKKKKDNDSKPELIKQEFPYQKEIPIHFNCEKYKHDYVQKESNGDVAFGCTPPWSSPSEDIKRFELVTNIEIEGLKIYESLAKPFTFLVIPEKFVIARDNETNYPAISLLQAVDPEELKENYVRLQVAIEPSINSFQWKKLYQKLLEENTDNSGGLKSLTVQLPSDLSNTEFDIEWPKLDKGLDFEAESFSYGDSFEFILIFESLEDATIATEIIKGKGALIGNLKYSIGSSLEESSLIDIDLEKTVGRVVDAQKSDKDSVLVHNYCESPIELKNLLFIKENQPEYRIKKFTSKFIIDPGSESEIGLENESFSIEDFGQIYVDYIIKEDLENIFSEKIVDLDLLQTELAVTTNLNAKNRKISKVKIEVKFPEIEQIETGTLVPSDGSFEESNIILDFTLPLKSGLSLDKKEIEYRAIIEYEDEKDDFNSDWITANIGTSTFLNITADRINLKNNS